MYLLNIDKKVASIFLITFFCICLIGVKEYFEKKEYSEALLLNVKLETYSFEAKLLIKAKQNNDALLLIEKIDHPKHLVWEQKSSIIKRVYFDEYWNKQRQILRKLLEKSL